MAGIALQFRRYMVRSIRRSETLQGPNPESSVAAFLLQAPGGCAGVPETPLDLEIHSSGLSLRKDTGQNQPGVGKAQEGVQCFLGSSPSGVTWGSQVPPETRCDSPCEGWSSRDTRWRLDVRISVAGCPVGTLCRACTETPDSLEGNQHQPRCLHM